MKNIIHSNQLYERAKSILPGGVNSPVRACRSVDCQPLFIDHAEGSHLFDADGHSYIDYVGSWGPMILGHRHPEVINALSAALNKGISYGAPTQNEIELAECILSAFPAMDMIRMVNSGTEATMSAIRLARACTQREKVVKFDGCYHGHADTLLVAAGSGVATLGIPGSPGIPESISAHTLSLPFNDLNAIEDVMKQQGDTIACVIVEPVAGNMGLVRPQPGFLEGLREITRKYGSLLIFDEVMCGYRVAYGGAQTLFNIEPDLTCLGKIIGGGMPVGAYGGKKALMNQIAPVGPVYQAGTLSGNPLAMVAGLSTLKQLQKPGFYDDLEIKTNHLISNMEKLATDSGISVQADHLGSMMGLFFTETPVKNFDDAKKCDLNRFTRFYQGMRERGIYIAPSQFEAGFMSAAHTSDDIKATIHAVAEVFKEL
ncbi:MAG: glutamate-1-semialdehyde 2,1-aminomutase [Candidatus Magnetomorum sp.]|nr:glutamate-1-semialdehyde 2,1-aminomutase [Candidatus Magnetomorum sp.]